MTSYPVPEPFQFNPLKHHLAFISEFISGNTGRDAEDDHYLRQLKHIGTSVMDIYAGKLNINEILGEVRMFLRSEGLLSKEKFDRWTGKGFREFKVIPLSDGSQWTLKHNDNEVRYVHLFPARSSPHTFRVKANTLKSAILYIIITGKDYITDEGLNKARAIAGLSPVKDVAESEAISEMIEILRI